MSDDARTGAGRPPFAPRPEQRQMVQVLRANGVPLDTIARNIGITKPTLRKYFRDELSHGFEQVKAAMGAALVKAGLGGNVGAQRYWLATQGGENWRPPTERREIGFTPPADGQVSTIPLLVLQPVMPSQVAAKPTNGHAVPPTDAQLREPIDED